MKTKKGINLVGLYEKLIEFAGRPKKPIPWGLTWKGKDELQQPGKAPAAKKKHRKMVQESRRKNR